MKIMRFKQFKQESVKDDVEYFMVPFLKDKGVDIKKRGRGFVIDGENVNKKEIEELAVKKGFCDKHKYAQMGSYC